MANIKGEFYYKRTDYSEEEVYTCSFEKVKIEDNNFDNFEVTWKHKEGETDIDVKKISLIKCIITKIPRGLTKVYVNLIHLEIFSSKITTIEKKDLIGMEMLKTFEIFIAQLEYLPGNLFEDMKDLEHISFSRNNIKFIGGNLLNGLEKLKSVDFRLNKSINLYWNSFDDSGSSTLDEIKQHILKNCIGDFQDLYEKSVKASLYMKDALKDDNFKDCTIKIEDEEFKLHKFLLAARSPTFAKLFIENSDVREYKINDISVENFKILIDFIYDNQLPNNNQFNFIEIFKMASRMKVEELKNFAASKMIDELVIENAFEFLVLANKHDHDELREKAFEKIKLLFPGLKPNNEVSKYPENIQILIEAKKEKEETIENAEKLKAELIDDAELKFQAALDALTVLAKP